MQVILKTSLYYGRRDQGGQALKPGDTVDLPEDVAADWQQRGLAELADAGDKPKRKPAAKEKTPAE